MSNLTNEEAIGDLLTATKNVEAQMLTQDKKIALLLSKLQRIRSLAILTDRIQVRVDTLLSEIDHIIGETD